jgi:hypothetical protein
MLLSCAVDQRHEPVKPGLFPERGHDGLPDEGQPLVHLAWLDLVSDYPCMHGFPLIRAVVESTLQREQADHAA